MQNIAEHEFIAEAIHFKIQKQSDHVLHFHGLYFVTGLKKMNKSFSNKTINSSQNKWALSVVTIQQLYLFLKGDFIVLVQESLCKTRQTNVNSESGKD